MKSKSLLVICFLIVCNFSFAQSKLKVVLAGLTHDHVNAILSKYENGEIDIIGIAEPDQQLCEKKKKDYPMPNSIFFKDLKTALQKTHPDLVMVYDAPSEHLKAVEICMPLHIPILIEKPLAFSYEDAVKMQALSEKFKTKIYTNFPSIWYSSFIELLKRSGDAGPISKMIMRGGHRGPIEVGCSKEFVNWLTDSVKNGGGALIDFGCYGAAIMTELMHGQTPLSVYASTKHLKPEMYPKADDAATIILEYKNATGIVEASWDFPYTIMDAEVYGNNEYLHASQFNTPQLQVKKDTATYNETIAAPEYNDAVEYLTKVMKKGAPDNNQLLSLDRNIIIVRILDAARKSARECKKILLR